MDALEKLLRTRKAITSWNSHVSLFVSKLPRISKTGRTHVNREQVVHWNSTLWLLAQQPGEETEERETLAQMAAKAVGVDNEQDETVLKKYSKGISHVESLLALDRLRQVWDWVVSVRVLILHPRSLFYGDKLTFICHPILYVFTPGFFFLELLDLANLSEHLLSLPRCTGDRPSTFIKLTFLYCRRLWSRKNWQPLVNLWESSLVHRTWQLRYEFIFLVLIYFLLCCVLYQPLVFLPLSTHS